MSIKNTSDKDCLVLHCAVPGHEYDINIGSGLLSRTVDYIPNGFLGKKIAIVTDSNVEPLYAKTLTTALRGFDTRAFTVPAGEHSKSEQSLFKLYAELLEFEITRGDLIIALGGGVVGDLTGFAASTLLRGIPYIQIPTTLLAQVDSSVGGKTAINLSFGKNLVGTFYQPKAVIIDTDCLDTLPNSIFSDGMAEVIKYGAISDSALFERLEKLNIDTVSDEIGEIIHTCCAIKSRIVEEDEHDTGMRMILNFGHTFGHAIEKYYNFDKYSHGMGVAAGMVMASEWGERRGITPSGTADRIRKILTQYQLPTDVELPVDAFLSAAAVDKKGDGNSINLITLKNIGKAEIRKISKSDLRASF